MNEQKMPRSKLYRIISVILLCVVIISGVRLAMNASESKRAEEEYRRLAELASQTTEATTETLTESVTAEEREMESEPETTASSPINFEELAKINPDIVGWIRVPGTNIDYPIVQTDNNDTYLHTDFEGNESIAGAVYLDFESDSDLMGYNNILYGHNMKNGSMFKDVVRFKDQSYFNDHLYFEIYTPERTIRLKAVSSYYDKAQPVVRKTRFKSRESYDAFVYEMIKPCAWAEIPQVPIDSLYILVTCSYEVNDARTFLFAIPVDENGDFIEGVK